MTKRCDMYGVALSAAEAHRLAVEHNPFNAPLRPSESIHPPPPDQEPVMEPELATVHTKRWRVETPIHVRFLNGSSSDHQAIAREAVKWEKYANVFFVFGNKPDAEIRIRLQAGGPNNSYVGTDALSVPAREETMNLGVWGSRDRGGTVLHEFGHALGFFHEHQSPKARFDWNKSRVYADMKKVGWSESKTDFNIFRRITRGVYASAYDRASIMHYDIPAHWLNSGSAVPDASTLSSRDRNFARRCYPSAEHQYQLSASDQPIELSPREDGAEEHMHVAVHETGTYRLATRGLHTGAAALYAGTTREPLSDVLSGDSEQLVRLDAGSHLLRVETDSKSPPFSMLFERTDGSATAEPVTMLRRVPKKTLRVFEGARLEVKAGDRFDDEPCIAFGEPQSGDVWELTPRPKPGQTVDLSEHLKTGRNFVRLRTINRRGRWNGAWSVFHNGSEISGSPFYDGGDDGLLQMPHSLVELVILMRPPF